MIAQHSSKSVEWYTPAKYIEAAREVMGGIDLDPASCVKAQETVKAGCWFGPEMTYPELRDGLAMSWCGRVWLNPPYGKTGGKSSQGVWSERLIREFYYGYVWQAIMLVNAVPDRKWFSALWQFPICFTDHRIKFIGAGSQPTHGNAFVYMGGGFERFADVFSQFGHVVMPRRQEQLVITSETWTTGQATVARTQAELEIPA